MLDWFLGGVAAWYGFFYLAIRFAPERCGKFLGWAADENTAWENDEVDLGDSRDRLIMWLATPALLLMVPITSSIRVWRVAHRHFPTIGLAGLLFPTGVKG